MCKKTQNCTKNNAILIKNCIVYCAKIKSLVLAINKRGKTKMVLPRFNYRNISGLFNNHLLCHVR